MENVKSCPFDEAKVPRIGKSGFNSLGARLEALLVQRPARSRAARSGARRQYWRQVKLGEKYHTWDDAVERCKSEDNDKRSWERTERALARLSRLLGGSPLREITRDNILKIREIRRRQVGASTVNRELAVLRFVLNRCVADWNMLDAAPKVPLSELNALSRDGQLANKSTRCLDGPLIICGTWPSLRAPLDYVGPTSPDLSGIELIPRGQRRSSRRLRPRANEPSSFR